MSPAKMSSRRRRGRPTPEVELTHRAVGNAMVVHAKDALTDEALALAMSVAPDPDHDLVVVDLPTGSPIGVWESLAAGLPRSRQGVRLVVGGRSREATALAGQWLAERLGRTVIAPDGTVVRGAGGSLFVHSGKDSGWVRFHPSKAPQWEAKRFPRPSWDSPVVAEFFPTSSTGAAEPLPGGVWIRPVGYEAPVRVGRSRLVNEMPCQPDVLSVVLGCPGTPAITVDDITRFCVRLPDDLLAKVRFVQYGPVRVQREDTLGQSLADALETEVICYTGMPVGSAQAPDVFTVHEDGTLGWHTFAQQIAFQPRKKPGDPLPLARMRVYRRPVEGVPELAPAQYWYAQDAVLEVVQAGLWIRPTDHDVNAPAVRSAPLDPTGNLLVFDGATKAQSDRMQALAEDVLGRLDYSLRQVSRLVPATALGQAQIRVAGRALAELDPADTAVRGVIEGDITDATDVLEGDVALADASVTERTEAIPAPSEPLAQFDLSATVSIRPPARRTAGQADPTADATWTTEAPASAPTTEAPKDAGPADAPNDAFGALGVQQDALGADAPNDALGASDAPNDAFGASGEPAESGGRGTSAPGAEAPTVSALAAKPSVPSVPAVGAAESGERVGSGSAEGELPAPVAEPGVPAGPAVEAPDPGGVLAQDAGPAVALAPAAAAVAPTSAPAATARAAAGASVRPATAPVSAATGTPVSAAAAAPLPPAIAASVPPATGTPVPSATAVSVPSATAPSAAAAPATGTQAPSATAVSVPSATAPSATAAPATGAQPPSATAPLTAVPAATGTPVPPATAPVSAATAAPATGTPIPPATALVPPATAPVAGAGPVSADAGSALSSASFRLESAPSDPPPAEAAPAKAVTPEPGQEPAATRVGTIVQPTPSSAASALLPTRGIDEERAWLRKNLGTQFGVLANTIARVLSEHPGFQGAVSRSSSDVLTEAVAVRVYLSEQGIELDQALRTATVGPHVPFARCVVAGLRRLPSHRGATVFRMTPTSEQWDIYSSHKLLTEWGFLNALTEPCAAQEGEADVLVWSMTARRTKLLEPDENPTEDRVLFVPGTSFKVLDAKRPRPGKLGQILVRELAESEIDAEGRVDANRISLDELAMKSLRRCAERWAQAKPRQRVPAVAADRFQALPGLA